MTDFRRAGSDIRYE